MSLGFYCLYYCFDVFCLLLSILNWFIGVFIVLVGVVRLGGCLVYDCGYSSVCLI